MTSPPKGGGRPAGARRLLAEGLLVALGQAVAMGGALVGVRVLTGVLDPTQYGEVALAVTLGNIVTQVSLGPIQQGALRFFGPALEVRELRACLAATWSLVRRTAVVVAALAVAEVLGLAVLGQSIWIGLAVGALALALVSGVERILDALQNAGRQRAITAWHQGLAQWLRFGIAIGLIRAFGPRPSLAVFGYVLATGLVLVSQVAFFRSRWWPVVSAEIRSAEATAKWRAHVQHYATPFAMFGAFTWLQQSSDRWALQTFSTTADVGYYAVLVQLGYTPVVLLTGIVVQLVQPIFSNRSGDGSDPGRLRDARRLNNRVVYAFFGIAIAASVIAQFVHRLVFAVFVAPQYQSASWLMPWMLLAGGLFACGELAALTLMISLQTSRLRVIKIVSAVIGIGLNIAGAHWSGLTGVVFASLGFSIVSLVWTYVTSVMSPPPVLRVPADPIGAATLAGT